MDQRHRADHSAEHAWDTDAGSLHNDAWPLQLAFHSFDPVLAVTDDADNIWSVLVSRSPDLADRHSIWDWKTRRKINKFSNQNVAGSSISSIHFVNEMANSLMLTASSESSEIVRGSGANAPSRGIGADLARLRDTGRDGARV